LPAEQAQGALVGRRIPYRGLGEKADTSWAFGGLDNTMLTQGF
jgi:hypothetical protein